jgi:hypothetical protein
MSGLRRRGLLLALAMAVAGASTPQAAVAPSAGPAPSPLPADATPEQIVDAQMEAYNRRDVEAFLAFYSDDAVLLRHPDVVTQTGKAEMRARYQRSFANKDARAAILKRITFGRFVIDHERITAPPAKGEKVAVAIYEIRDGKIVRVTFLDP